MNHLTYKQCQNLKGMGFPQDTFFRYGNYEPTKGIPYGQNTPLLEGEVAVPNLEELMEWLGNDLWGLRWLKPFSGAKIGWVAEPAPGLNVGEQKGKTPLEAAYKLAEAIKGKDSL